MPSYSGSSQLAPMEGGPFGDLSQYARGQGYSLSYQGGDKDRLMTDSAYKAEDFPAWMGGAPVGAIQNWKKGLNKAYDFSPIRGAYDQLAEQQRSAMGASTAAAANAAVNRQMLAGGRVGAGFAQASAMLPLMRQQAGQNLELGALQAQMMQQKSQAALQAALAMSQMRQTTQGRQQDYAVNAARLAQKNIGFGTQQNASYGQGRGQGQGYGGGGGQANQSMTPGYVTNSGPVIPATVNGMTMQNSVIAPSELFNQNLRYGT